MEEQKGQVSALRLIKVMLILPGTATVLVPSVLLYLEGNINPGFASGRTLRGILSLSNSKRIKHPGEPMKRAPSTSCLPRRDDMCMASLRKGRTS
jgi:hypothetical protein